MVIFLHAGGTLLPELMWPNICLRWDIMVTVGAGQSAAPPIRPHACDQGNVPIQYALERVREIGSSDPKTRPGCLGGLAG